MGWIIRLVLNSVVGALIGLMLIPLATLLLGWNEFRTVRRTAGIAEAARDVVSVSDLQQVAEDLNEKFIHLSGLATTDDTLRDPEFAVEDVAIHLARRVEMYQWVETKKTTGRRANRQTEYTYDLKWREGMVNSNRFEHSADHRNPQPQYEEITTTAADVHIGVYQLSDYLKQGIDRYEPISLEPEELLAEVPQEQREHFLVRGAMLYWREEGTPDPNRPQLGDLRISFEKVQPLEVSLVAGLHGNRLGEYQTSNGEIFEHLYVGTRSVDEVMQSLSLENSIMAWFLRVLGMGLIVTGFWMFLGPIRSVASFVPILAELTAGLVFVLGILLGGVVSLVVIGTAWVVVRPVLGISLLLVASAATILVLNLLKGRKKSAPEEELVTAEAF